LFLAIYKRRKKVMLDAIAAWQKPTVGTPTGYYVAWTYNGAALAPQLVPATAAQDVAGYSLDFATANPTITVAPGDIIGASIQAVDATDTLSGPITPTVPPTVTEPAAPPPAPGPVVNPTLTLA
jgi:hypothetical protein